MAALEDTFNAVNDEWSTPKTVHIRVNRWSPLTVQHSLAILAKAGLIERREIPAHPFPAAQYRTKQPTPPAPSTEQQLLSLMKEISQRKRCYGQLAVTPTTTSKLLTIS